MGQRAGLARQWRRADARLTLTMANAQSSTLDQPKLTNKWVVLALLLSVALVNYGDRYLLAGLVEPIKAEFGVSDGFMGLLMGPAFALLYSLLAIPIARYADRVSRVAILCTGCIVWSGFTILSGFANDPWMLALARVGVGVGGRFYTSFGPVRLDLATPLNRRPGESRFNVYVSIGQAF